MDGWFFRQVSRFVPLKKELCEHCFFVREEGRWLATPLFMCLLAVEMSDILFAFDSVPAILTISRDSFVIYTSNLFAILGLRSLFFALSGALRYFRFLNYGLAIILTYIGVKILVEEWWRVPIGLALGFVGLVLGATVLLSLMFPARKEA